jgi:hypothetical protein
MFDPNKSEYVYKKSEEMGRDVTPVIIMNMNDM